MTLEQPDCDSSKDLAVSVVVPSFNSARTVEACVNALLDQDLPDHDYEILLVDNNSTDDSAERIARFEKRVRLLAEPSQGAYAARNRGLRHARGQFIAFTDPDCLPRQDWLSSGLAALRSGAEVVIGRNNPPPGSRAIDRLMLYEHHKDRYTLSAGDRRLYYGHTNNMAATREALRRCGPFVERPRGSDTIFVRRVVEALGTDAVQYEPGMRVTHLEVNRLMVYLRKVFIYGRSRRLYRHIMETRALSTRERVQVFRAVRKSEDLTTSASVELLSLLLLGVVSWNIGSLLGLAGDSDEHPASHGSSRSAASGE